MRSARILRIFGLLILISLACNLPANMFDPSPMRVETVQVKQTNVGEFTASVYILRHLKEDTLECYTVNTASEGSGKKVFTQKVSANDNPDTVTFHFTEDTPGTYTMYCMDKTEMISVKDTFSVSEPSSGKEQSGQENNPPANQPSSGNAGSPQSYQSGGTITQYGGEYTCQTPAKVTLTILKDGSARMSYTGMRFYDTINCTPTDFIVTSELNGTNYPALQEVQFSSCNNEKMGGNGSVTYTGGKLSGTATCIWGPGAGDDNGKPATSVRVP